MSPLNKSQYQCGLTASLICAQKKIVQQKIDCAFILKGERDGRGNLISFFADKISVSGATFD